MPFNGSGTYNPPSAPTWPAVPNTLIESADYNNVITDLATALTNCMTRDGQSPCTANIPLGGFKITGLGNGVANTDAAAFGQSMVLRGAIGASDWDNLLNTGIYEAEASSLTGPASNFPPTSEVGQLLVAAQGATITHLYLSETSSFSRFKTGSTWSDWTRSAKAISANTTLSVPSEFATIAAAMSYLQEYRIDPDVTVTISLANGTYNVTSSTSLNHPDGQRIRLIGNTGSPSSVVLNWNGTPNDHTLKVTDGYSFGLINGIQFSSNAVALFGAIAALTNGAVTVGANNIYNAMGYSFYASENAYLEAEGGTINGTDGSTRGGLCTLGSTMVLSSVTMTNGVLGLSSTLGSKIILSSCTITSMTTDGIQADNNSLVVLAGGNTVSSNTSDGIQLSTGSIAVEIGTNTLSSNGVYGINYNTGVYVRGNTWSGSGNGTALESPVAFFVNGGIQNNTTDLTLTPNSGHVKFGTHAAIGAETITGYIEIKDAGGTIRKLAVVS